MDTVDQCVSYCVPVAVLKDLILSYADDRCEIAGLALYLYYIHKYNKFATQVNSCFGTGTSLFDLFDVSCVDSISSELVVQQLKAYTIYNSQFHQLLTNSFTKINKSPLKVGRRVETRRDWDTVEDLVFNLTWDQTRQIIQQLYTARRYIESVKTSLWNGYFRLNIEGEYYSTSFDIFNRGPATFENICNAIDTELRKFSTSEKIFVIESLTIDDKEQEISIKLRKREIYTPRERGSGSRESFNGGRSEYYAPTVKIEITKIH